MFFFWATLHWFFNYITENYIKKYLYARALIIHFVRSSIKTNSLLYMSIMIEMMMIYSISLSCNMLFLPICKFVWGPAFYFFCHIHNDAKKSKEIYVFLARVNKILFAYYDLLTWWGSFFLNENKNSQTLRHQSRKISKIVNVANW